MIAVVIDGAVKAELTAMSGDRVTLVSDGAFAPGSRIAARTAEGEVVRIKVHRSVRQHDRFAVEGRTFDMRRELRESLAKRLAPS